MLFEEKTRTFSGRKMESQSNWSYLDAIADSWAENVREFLNSWVSEFPEGEDRNELIQRFRSKDDVNFDSAGFEVILFAILRSMGCAVSVHPELNNGSLKHPDFLAVTPEGESIYVEAVKASDLTGKETIGAASVNRLYDYLDEMDSPNFSLHAHPENFPQRPLNLKRIRREVRVWLDSLDPDEVIQRRQEKPSSHYPERAFEFDGWKIEFTAIPNAQGSRSGEGRVVKVRQWPMRWGTSRENIREAIKRKGKRYGELMHPLLIAVNFDGFGVDNEDVTDALYGYSSYNYQEGDADALLTHVRSRNGAWNGPSKAQLRRASGLWLFKRLSVWSLTGREMRIYENHQTHFALPPLFRSLPSARVENGQLVFSEGWSLESILGLEGD